MTDAKNLRVAKHPRAPGRFRMRYAHPVLTGAETSLAFAGSGTNHAVE